MNLCIFVLLLGIWAIVNGRSSVRRKIAYGRKYSPLSSRYVGKIRQTINLAEKNPAQKGSIPQAYLIKMRSVNNIEDFIRIFKPKGVTAVKTITRTENNKQKSSVAVTLVSKQRLTSYGRKFPNRKSGIMGRPGTQTTTLIMSDSVPESGCIPRKQVATIPIRSNRVLYYPDCVYVKKCGGCCSNPYITECRAVETETITINAFRILPYSLDVPPSMVAVPIQQDKKCSCECRIRKEHCTHAQQYVAGDCACRCKSRVLTCSSRHIWSDSICACVCERTFPCSPANYRWDGVSCSCVPIASISRKVAHTRRPTGRFSHGK